MNSMFLRASLILLALIARISSGSCPNKPGSDWVIANSPDIQLKSFLPKIYRITLLSFPGTLIRIIQLFIVNRQCILQFLYKGHRTIETYIRIKSCPPGQNLMCFHFMFSRIQQSSDIRIGRIFFNVYPFTSIRSLFVFK